MCVSILAAKGQSGALGVTAPLITGDGLEELIWTLRFGNHI